MRFLLLPLEQQTVLLNFGIQGILKLQLLRLVVKISHHQNGVHLFNVLQLDKGPVKSFKGCDIGTFLVKAKLSPDAGHILSGSSDGFAYVWQVNKPQVDPIKLEGHDAEVTAVDWCSYEMGKIATCADDSVVQLWNINSSCYSTTRSPSSIRRREKTLPGFKRRKLFTDEETNDQVNGDEPDSSAEPPVKVDSPDPTSVTEMRTPESLKKQISKSHIIETCERSPDASFGSLSSVLNPPPSLKRKNHFRLFCGSFIIGLAQVLL